MTIVRPTIVLGPNVDNYISRSWQNSAFLPIMDGVEAEFQLVHEDDVVSALTSLLDEKASGAFNLAADDTMTWRESADLAGVKTRDMSFKTAYRIADISWKLRLPRVESPAGNLHFLRYPWIVSNEKLKATTGWEPTHDTRETFEITMRAKGMMQSSTPVAPTTPSVA
jgi:nucleoside-diphosphate-sugar epimerase